MEYPRVTYELSNSLAPPIVESSPFVCGYQWIIMGYGMINTLKKIRFPGWHVTWWLTSSEKVACNPTYKCGQFLRLDSPILSRIISHLHPIY